MQKTIFCVVGLVVLFCSALQAQNKTFEVQVQEISSRIEVIAKEEKLALKQRIDTLNDQLESREINAATAAEQKSLLAAESVALMQKRIAVEQRTLEDLVQNRVTASLTGADASQSDTARAHTRTMKLEYKFGDKARGTKRTTSQLVLAAGLSNLITDGALAHSDMRYFESGFFELGFTYNSRLHRDRNLWHLKYGVSLMYHNLRPSDNRIFVSNGSQVDLAVFNKELKESKLRTLNLVVPVHLEFDFSDKITAAEGTKQKFKSHQSWRIGLGAYAGFNIKNKQVLKYTDQGKKYKVKEKNAFNTEDFVYGLSTYVGYKQTSLYLKYDLNKVFAANERSQKNISLGLRFDVN